MPFFVRSQMEHTRSASSEGWRLLAVLAIVAPALGFGTLLFEMGLVWRTIWTLGVLAISGLAVAYAVGNIRTGGEFLCRLTDEEFIQSIPVPSCGESFQIKLSEISAIECHEGFGESPSDEWYLHTKKGRYRITTNYGNPYRAFAEGIQKALPGLEKIQT